MNVNVNKNQPLISLKPEPFKIIKRMTVCFERCSDNQDIPVEKNQVKKVIEALRSFYDADKLSSRKPHPLNKGSKNKRINELLSTYSDTTLFSIDVGHRGGKGGNIRLLYHIDKTNPTVAKIVRLFIDTH